MQKYFSLGISLGQRGCPFAAENGNYTHLGKGLTTSADPQSLIFRQSLRAPRIRDTLFVGMRILYFDCFSGVSGNMILGALISSGIDAAALEEHLRKLNLPGLRFSVNRVMRSGISAVHVSVTASDEKKHRHLPEIEKIIDGSDLPQTVQERAKAIFRRLASAEASVHDVPVEKVHFHEVGALDAIVDIVGASIAIEMLGPERIIASPINVGSGRIQIEHGHFPVPPPAVVELARGVPIYSEGPAVELATPTGMAIITTIADSYGVLPKLTLESIGYGAGTKDLSEFPNVLRVLTGQTAATETEENIEHLVLLESNIDDSPPQALGLIMERVLSEGALDCWFTAVQMKKNRPAVAVSILVRPADELKIRDLLYKETTTIGMRRTVVERHCLARTIREVQTEFGPIRVKLAALSGKIINIHPEFDDVRRASETSGADFARIYEAAIRKAASTQ
ncbi:MAG: nickel pincer cofactor biosynthesis protein LarC [Blastocatellia bacterium]